MGEGCAWVAACHDEDGGIVAAEVEGETMLIAELCLILGALFAFATLVVKIIEVSRNR